MLSHLEVAKVPEHSHPEAGLSGDNAQRIPYQSDPATVVGVVAAGSHDAWGDLEDGYVVRAFRLSPWKFDGGSASKAPLQILEKVPYQGTPDEDGEDEDWWDTFWTQCPDGETRRLHIRISEDHSRGVLIARDTISGSENEALTSESSARQPGSATAKGGGQETRSLRLGEFGALEFAQAAGAYRGTVSVAGGHFQLTVESQLDHDPQVDAQRALQWLGRMDRINADACEYAASQLLSTKNSDWLGVGESAVGSSDFLRRMQLQSVELQSDGSVDLVYDDGDLFWGHLIVVSGDSTGWRSVNLQG